MSPVSDTPSGSCLCGNIEFKLLQKPLVVFTCFCEDCRKNSGHLGQILAKYPTSQVQVDLESPSIGVYTVTKTTSGAPKKKYFCRDCGCTILTMPMKHGGEEVFIRATLLNNGLQDFVPTKAIFKDSIPENFRGLVIL